MSLDYFVERKLISRNKDKQALKEVSKMQAKLFFKINTDE